MVLHGLVSCAVTSHCPRRYYRGPENSDGRVCSGIGLWSVCYDSEELRKRQCLDQYYKQWLDHLQKWSLPYTRTERYQNTYLHIIYGCEKYDILSIPLQGRLEKKRKLHFSQMRFVYDCFVSDRRSIHQLHHIQCTVKRNFNRQCHRCVSMIRTVRISRAWMFEL